MFVTFIAFFVTNLRISHATPLYNIQDPAIIHTIYGTDKYYTVEKQKRSRLQMHISPYFQHTAKASKAGSGKIDAGDIYGKWNMFAIFFGNAKPSGQTVTKFEAAKSAISSLSSGSDYVDEAKFDPNKHTIGAFDNVGIRYEKKGIRGQFSFDFGFGLGLVLKAGIADYKLIPNFALSNDFKQKAGLPYLDEEGKTQTGTGEDPEKTVYSALLSPYARNNIARELGLDLTEQHATELEDLHASLRWNIPFKIKDKKEDLVCTLIPHLTIGAWLPVGVEKDTNKPFSISTGNNGFTSFTLEGAVTLDFPGMLQISGGAGMAIFNSRELNDQRVPTSDYQVGFIPWKTSISLDPGTLWYANVSFKAENFSPDFSFYLDYIYTHHAKDTITIKETNATRKALFKPQMLEEQSLWKAQQMNAGLKYDLTAHCSLGFAVQGYIGGERTFRTTTMLGSLIIVF